MAAFLNFWLIPPVLLQQHYNGNGGWIMDGLLKVDLTDLATDGTFVLMSHEKDDMAGESMAGVLSLTVIPEPATLGLVAVAAGAVIGMRRLRLH